MQEIATFKCGDTEITAPAGKIIALVEGVFSKKQSASSAVPELRDGEVYLGIELEDGIPANHLILMDGEFVGDHDSAISWAQERGGRVMNRVAGAMAFAYAKSLFKPEWYWLEEQYSSYYAWGQGFYGGNVNNCYKGSEARVRAVRRLPI